MKMLVLAAGLVAMMSLPAHAFGERTATGVAIGAGSGALIAGPPGALVGGVIGGVVGGPRVSGRSRSCWRDSRGYRRCRYR